MWIRRATFPIASDANLAARMQLVENKLLATMWNKCQQPGTDVVGYDQIAEQLYGTLQMHVIQLAPTQNASWCS